MPEIADSALSHPTMWGFLSLVMAKAGGEEKKKWLYRVYVECVKILSTALVATLTGTQAGLTAGWITGLVGLLMLAGSRGAMFFIVGSHKLHCDQLDKYSAIQTANAAQVGALSSNLSSVATERDSLASRIESKPLSRFDAIRHLRAFSRWLYAESH